ATGECKSASDIIYQQSVRFPILLDQLNQLCPQLRIRHHLAAFDDQIPLSRNRRGAQLPPPMSVRMRESNQWRPRHLKILQYTAVHQCHLLRRHSLIIELVVSQQIFIPQFFPRRVIHNRQELRKNRFSHCCSKSLSCCKVLLPVSFCPMPENFMEENCSRTPCQHGRTNGWLVDRCLHQSFHLFAQCRARGSHGLVVWCVLRINPVEVVITLDIHSIRGFSLYEQFQPVTNLPVLQLRPFRVHLIHVLRQGAKRHNRIQNRLRFTERFRIRTHALFPWPAV